MALFPEDYDTDPSSQVLVGDSYFGEPNYYTHHHLSYAESPTTSVVNGHHIVRRRTDPSAYHGRDGSVASYHHHQDDDYYKKSGEDCSNRGSSRSRIENGTIQSSSRNHNSNSRGATGDKTQITQSSASKGCCDVVESHLDHLGEG